MLTEEQIQCLFTFCEKHFVKYYDVQVELVDHLANAVELEMKNDPKLKFENALEKVHKSFGVMGFAPLVADKQKQAEKQSTKLFWSLLKAQFGWPKVLTLIFLSAVFFTMFSFDVSLIPAISVVCIFICWPILLIGIVRLQKEVSKTGKKFLTINYSWISTLLLLPIYSINFSSIFTAFHDESIFSYTSNQILLPGVSIFLSLYLLVIIAVWQTLSSVKTNLYQTYPEVFSGKSVGA